MGYANIAKFYRAKNKIYTETQKYSNNIQPKEQYNLY